MNKRQFLALFLLVALVAVFVSGCAGVSRIDSFFEDEEYKKHSKLIDFGLFFTMFFALGYLGFSMVWGKGFGKPGEGKGAIVGLSLALALALSFALVTQTRLSITSMFPVAKAIFFIIIWFLLWGLLDKTKVLGEGKGAKIAYFILAGIMVYLLASIATHFICQMSDNMDDRACDSDFFNAIFKLTDRWFDWDFGGGPSRTRPGTTGVPGTTDPGVTTTVDPNKINGGCRLDITFKFNSPTEFVSSTPIAEYVKSVQRMKKDKVHIYGFASREGEERWNFGLAGARAKTIAAMIEKIDPSIKTSINSKGPDDRFDKAKYEPNRRVVVTTESMTKSFLPFPPPGKANKCPTEDDPQVCGNEVREDPEECDGNDDEKCPKKCVKPGEEKECTCPDVPPDKLCGNGVVDAEEECDTQLAGSCPVGEHCSVNCLACVPGEPTPVPEPKKERRWWMLILALLLIPLLFLFRWRTRRVSARDAIAMKAEFENRLSTIKQRKQDAWDHITAMIPHVPTMGAPEVENSATQLINVLETELRTNNWGDIRTLAYRYQKHRNGYNEIRTDAPSFNIDDKHAELIVRILNDMETRYAPNRTFFVRHILPHKHLFNSRMHDTVSHIIHNNKQFRELHMFINQQGELLKHTRRFIANEKRILVSERQIEYKTFAGKERGPLTRLVTRRRGFPWIRTRQEIEGPLVQTIVTPTSRTGLMDATQDVLDLAAELRDKADEILQEEPHVHHTNMRWQDVERLYDEEKGIIDKLEKAIEHQKKGIIDGLQSLRIRKHIQGHLASELTITFTVEKVSDGTTETVDVIVPAGANPKGVTTHPTAAGEYRVTEPNIPGFTPIGSTTIPVNIPPKGVREAFFTNQQVGTNNTRLVIKKTIDRPLRDDLTIDFTVDHPGSPTPQTVPVKITAGETSAESNPMTTIAGNHTVHEPPTAGLDPIPAGHTAITRNIADGNTEVFEFNNHVKILTIEKKIEGELDLPTTINFTITRPHGPPLVEPLDFPAHRIDHTEKIEVPVEEGPQTVEEQDIAGILPMNPTSGRQNVTIPQTGDEQIRFINKTTTLKITKRFNGNLTSHETFTFDIDTPAGPTTKTIGLIGNNPSGHTTINTVEGDHTVTEVPLAGFTCKSINPQPFRVSKGEDKEIEFKNEPSGKETLIIEKEIPTPVMGAPVFEFDVLVPGSTTPVTVPVSVDATGKGEYRMTTVEGDHTISEKDHTDYDPVPPRIQTKTVPKGGSIRAQFKNELKKNQHLIISKKINGPVVGTPTFEFEVLAPGSNTPVPHKIGLSDKQNPVEIKIPTVPGAHTVEEKDLAGYTCVTAKHVTKTVPAGGEIKAEFENKANAPPKAQLTIEKEIDTALPHNLPINFDVKKPDGSHVPVPVIITAGNTTAQSQTLDTIPGIHTVTEPSIPDFDPDPPNSKVQSPDIPAGGHELLKFKNNKKAPPPPTKYTIEKEIDTALEEELTIFFKVFKPGSTTPETVPLTIPAGDTTVSETRVTVPGDHRVEEPPIPGFEHDPSTPEVQSATIPVGGDEKFSFKNNLQMATLTIEKKIDVTLSDNLDIDFRVEKPYGFKETVKLTILAGQKTATSPPIDTVAGETKVFEPAIPGFVHKSPNRVAEVIPAGGNVPVKFENEQMKKKKPTLTVEKNIQGNITRKGTFTFTVTDPNGKTRPVKLKLDKNTPSASETIDTVPGKHTVKETVPKGFTSVGGDTWTGTVPKTGNAVASFTDEQKKAPAPVIIVKPAFGTKIGKNVKGSYYPTASFPSKTGENSIFGITRKGLGIPFYWRIVLIGKDGKTALDDNKEWKTKFARDDKEYQRKRTKRFTREESKAKVGETESSFVVSSHFNIPYNCEPGKYKVYCEVVDQEAVDKRGMNPDTIDPKPIDYNFIEFEVKNPTFSGGALMVVQK
jgi:hypothetical protein